MGLLDKFKSAHKKINIEAEKAIQELNKKNTNQYSETSLDSMKKDINRLSNRASYLQSTPIEHLDDPKFQDTPEEKAFCEYIQVVINGNYSRYVSYSEVKQIINFVDDVSERLGYTFGTTLATDAGIQTFFNILSSTDNQAGLQSVLLNKLYYNIELNPETYNCLKAVNQKIDLTQHFIKRASKDYDIHFNYGSVVPQTGVEYWKERKETAEYMYKMAGTLKTAEEQMVKDRVAEYKEMLTKRQSEKVPQANPISTNQLPKEEKTANNGLEKPITKNYANPNGTMAYVDSIIKKYYPEDYQDSLKPTSTSQEEKLASENTDLKNHEEKKANEELEKKQKQEAQMSQFINSLNNKTGKSQKIVYDPNFENVLNQWLPPVSADVDAKPIISVKDLIDTINIIDDVCDLKTFFDVIYSTDDKKDTEFIEETYRRFNEKLVSSGLSLDHNNYILTVESIRELGKGIGSTKALQWFEIQRGQTMSSEYWKKENHNALNTFFKSMSFF